MENLVSFSQERPQGKLAPTKMPVAGCSRPVLGRLFQQSGKEQLQWDTFPSTVPGASRVLRWKRHKDLGERQSHKSCLRPAGSQPQVSTFAVCASHEGACRPA